MRQPVRRGRPAPPTRRGSWAESRSRAMYNLALSVFAIVAGFVILAFPAALGSQPQARYWGAVLMGYGVVRGYHFLKRLRAIPRNQD